MKSKGQIKLSEKQRNQLNLICGSPCDRTTRKVFGRICKRKQSQASEICICIPYIYICIIHVLHIKIELVWVGKTLSLSKISTTNCKFYFFFTGVTCAGD